MVSTVTTERPTQWRALFFDVQGTLTDFRSTLIEHGARILGDRLDLSTWEELVDRWRGHYRDELAALVTQGRWRSVRAVYRDALVALLNDLPTRIEVTPAEIDALTMGWERLRPWPDAPAGLRRLRERHVVVALSNADHAAVVNVARHAGFQWDTVLSAQIFGAYKPDSATYEGALALLAVEPAEAMMVASHAYDLDAAAAVGMATAYIRRPWEFGPGSPVEQVPDGRYDFVVDDLGALATALG
ncbi:haloacid dehalogenase, type II [Prauserella coralliicola]|nr:haloacid dehalogenase, type II [Prauserella coralliicola]